MMFMTHKAASQGIHMTAPSGSSPTASRMMAYEPNFMSTPACSMLTANGAAAWPIGYQLCRGHIGAMTPKPTTSKGKIHRCSEGASGWAANACWSAGRSNVLTSELT